MLECAYKDKLIWIPQRCEVIGCMRTEHLSKCDKCGMVMYCGREHRKRDWKRHRKECEHLKKLRLFGYPYIQDVELAKYPIGIFPTLKDMSPPSICGLCGSEENIVKTPCCGLGICSPYKQGGTQMSSRRCHHFHMRYTLCGYHHGQRHQSADWRDCQRCALLLDTPYSNNGYNFTPRLYAEKGIFLTDECSRCPARVHTTYDNYVIYPGGNLRCMSCSNTQRFSFNASDAQTTDPTI